MLNFGLIGSRFKKLRDESGLTQAQMADFLKVDQSYISKCEQNERQFSLDILEKSGNLFGCTVDYFTNDTGEYTSIAFAFRAKSITTEDLEAISVINKLALNLRYMKGLLKEEQA